LVCSEAALEFGIYAIIEEAEQTDRPECKTE
jgi:hypothetical protein